MIPHYTRNLKAPKGAVTATVFLALNEAAGNYTLKLRDVATGIAAQKTVPVE